MGLELAEKLLLKHFAKRDPESRGYRQHTAYVRDSPQQFAGGSIRVKVKSDRPGTPLSCGKWRYCKDLVAPSARRMYTVRMSLRFEWHPTKNVANKRNHGVSFEEAQTVFYDDEAIMIDDPEHSKEEHRFILLGMSRLLRVLLVSHCARDEGDTIRIISARRANRHEQREYRERYGQ